MSVWEYLLLFLTVVGSSGVALIFGERLKPMIRLILAFSGAYILGITFLHLVPEVYETAGHEIGFFVLGGFVLQFLLEHLSRGIEHGHIHAPHHPSRSFAISMMLGLCLHAFIEGIPLADYTHFEDHRHHHTHSINHLLFGINFHNIPATFALTLLLVLSGYRKLIVLCCVVIFALMSPLGAGLASVLDAHHLLPASAKVALLAVVIGSFLHISTTILFEADSNQHHHFSWDKIGVVVLGLGLAILTI